MKIKDIPFESLKQLALRNQVMQGNPRNEEICIRAGKLQGGFDWDQTDHGRNFWKHIRKHEFNEARLIFDWDNPEIQYVKEEVFTPQPHYDNSNGSLYAIATTLGLNHWEFDIFKRLVRCRKKNQFKEDLQKIKDTIDIYLDEYQ